MLKVTTINQNDREKIDQSSYDQSLKRLIMVIRIQMLIKI